MTKVVIDVSMSLDGFIAGPEDSPEFGLGKRGGEHIFDWFDTGGKKVHGVEYFRPEGVNREVVEEMYESSGAMLTGRRTYEITSGWGGSHPIKGLPIVIMSHTVPDDIPEGDSEIVFVTDGIEAAVEKAKALAGDKDVGIGGASAAQQALKAGLVDEILLHVAPIVLGDGVRLFDHLGDDSIKLERLDVRDGKQATHMRYRVVH